MLWANTSILQELLIENYVGKNNGQRGCQVSCQHCANRFLKATRITCPKRNLASQLVCSKFLDVCLMKVLEILVR
jgi:hypothetical protein